MKTLTKNTFKIHQMISGGSVLAGLPYCTPEISRWPLALEEQLEWNHPGVGNRFR